MSINRNIWTRLLYGTFLDFWIDYKPGGKKFVYHYHSSILRDFDGLLRLLPRNRKVWPCKRWLTYTRLTWIYQSASMYLTLNCHYRLMWTFIPATQWQTACVASCRIEVVLSSEATIVIQCCNIYLPSFFVLTGRTRIQCLWPSVVVDSPLIWAYNFFWFWGSSGGLADYARLPRFFFFSVRNVPVVHPAVQILNALENITYRHVDVGYMIVVTWCDFVLPVGCWSAMLHLWLIFTFQHDFLAPLPALTVVIMSGRLRGTGRWFNFFGNC